MLDQDTPALDIILDVFGGGFERAHADAEIFCRLDDLARAEIDAGGTQRTVLHKQVVVRHKHVLEYHLAVVHEAAAKRLVAAGDGKSLGLARHQERRRALQHANFRVGIGIDDVEARIVAIGNKLLASVDHPAAIGLDGFGLHCGFRHVVRQPAV